MKKLGYWGKHDVCVRCGQYIYNISIWLDPNRSNKTERPKEELPQAYLDILEKREWSVCDYTDDGRVELEWYSPAGEDFIVCVKVENFPDEILDYSDSFDPDEHIAMWIEAKQNGTQGVPGARQIVHDAEEIEKELDELAFELQEAEKKIMAYRYYSTLRPLMVGGIPFPKQPGESITTIVNFEEGRTYCKDIDRPAWGYIEYTAPLDQQQVSDYELVQAPQEADHE